MHDSARTFKLLFVDDDPNTIRLLNAVFESDTRFEALSATTGDDAVRICRLEQPDLLVLDVGLPGSDGYRVCRLVKHDPTCGDVRVVFLSGLPPTGDLWWKLGADEFLAKPVHPEELVRTVERCLKMAPIAA